MNRIGTALVVVGLVVLGYGGLWQLGLVPGSRVTLPPPVALDKVRPTPIPTVALEEPRPTPVPTALVLDRPAPTPVPPVAPEEPRTAPAPTVALEDARAAPGAATLAVAPAPAAPPRPIEEPTLVPPIPTAAPIHLAPADAPDRGLVTRQPPPGYAVRLAIPAIKLDTPVKQGGIVEDAAGNPIWQTLPFVAVHYGDLTALIGQRGNAVIAGHVVTLSQGNVFRFLYQLDIDDEIQVWDDKQDEFDYHVVDVKLVPPSDTSVMEPTPDETLTLITCGGTFDPVRREFSDRLIVTAKRL